eukprot:scaffold38435_cov27-Phaeocystis_antarctica.AAC.1
MTRPTDSSTRPTSRRQRQHGQSAPLAAPQLGSCASPGRAWRLWAARHCREEAGPLGAQALPRLLELAASKAADSTALDPSGEANLPQASAGRAARRPRGQRRAAADGERGLPRSARGPAGVPDHERRRIQPGGQGGP